ncbi:rRNA maturation RNase YbeY [Rubritepida flocculans]|jgi:probable rRNA maturation factor|uniref:rRNA maturation RNase YbeY n=1 Tax=Rubritepida flocculans TaxID=182403 RepID=UPI0006856B90|nr:rRNA maturation RNase YbeY [Rubritepida flocculans]
MGPGSSAPGGGIVAAGPVVEVVFGAPGWRAALPRVEALARRCVAAALADQGATGHVTLLLTDDADIRRLNAGFRGKEKATNVLSFPAPYGALTLGDLAVSLGVLRREAAAEGRALAAHFAHLVVHGTLHLLGHDHLSAGEAAAMERAEARILRRLGQPNPWRPRWRLAA